MENKVEYLQRTVAEKEKRLVDLTWRMEKWERAISQASLLEDQEGDPDQESSVFNLLQDVTQVREEYENLRSDITEIHQLQKEVSQSLKSQLNVMHEKYGFLRSKLGPTLPSCLMMSANSYQPSPAKQNGLGPRTQSQ